MPSKNWAKKAIGSNGQRGLALTAAAQGSRQLGPVSRTLTMSSYMLNATLGQALPRPDLVFEAGLFQPDTPSPSYPVDIQRPGQMGGPIPRIWQYPIAWNLPTQPRAFEAISFDTLYSVGNGIDAVRTAINIIKDEVVNGEWVIRAKNPTEAKEILNYKTDVRRRIRQFFDYPDPLRGMNFAEWAKMLLESTLVTDALAIHPRRKLLASDGIDLAALQILDGATIKPLLDLQGGVPQSPWPAYQQYLYGVPRSEFAKHDRTPTSPYVLDSSIPDGRNLQVEQLIYKRYVERPNTVYGLPPTETVIQAATTWLRRETWWSSYFSEGDIPAMFIMGGEGWTPDQLERWEAALHSLMSGDPGFKWRMKAVPFGTNIKEMKMPNFDVAFDEFMLKMVAMIFRITPSELFGITGSSGAGGRGFLEEQAGIEERKFISPLRRWIQGICDYIIAYEFGEPDLCLRFIDEDKKKALQQAQIDDLNLGNGSTFIEEVRAERGQAPLNIPEAGEPHIETRAGLTTLDKIDELTDLLIESEKNGKPAGGTGGTAGTKGPSPLSLRSQPGPGQGSPAATKAMMGELEQFAKFYQSGERGRPFNFNLLEGELREVLESAAMNWFRED